jgi:branched-chain amino acid transport system ATP-binding protein
MLTIKNLVTQYASIKALDDISFQAKPGVITTVIGANGAGKSTLLRTISGLEKPTSGTIHWFDKELTRMSVESIVRGGVAQVPEGHAVISQLSVAENIELGGLFRKRIARGDLAVATKEVYELFPILHDRRNEPAGSLSGGERQMLAISRALVSRPKLLLLDEPSLGLAPLITAQIIETVNNLCRNTGLTVLLVEQNANTALKVAEHGILLALGKVVADAPARELINDSALRTAYLGY